MSEGDKQRLELVERKFLNLLGVEEVMNYDEEVINLKTNLGDLRIEGKELKIKELDLEERKLIVSGKISSLKYDNEKKGNFLKKLFR